MYLFLGINRLVSFQLAGVMKYPVKKTLHSVVMFSTDTQLCNKGSPCVDTRIVLISTAPASAHYSNQHGPPLLLNPEWPARVTLASVLTSDYETFLRRQAFQLVSAVYYSL